MKIRVKIPEELVGPLSTHQYLMQRYVDDILLWGMETEMDIEFYKFYCEPKDNHWNSKQRWAVFNVEADYSYMFSLKYGATLHKPKEKNREV